MPLVNHQAVVVEVPNQERPVQLMLYSVVPVVRMQDHPSSSREPAPIRTTVEDLRERGPPLERGGLHASVATDVAMQLVVQACAHDRHPTIRIHISTAAMVGKRFSFLAGSRPNAICVAGCHQSLSWVMSTYWCSPTSSSNTRYPFDIFAAKNVGRQDRSGRKPNTSMPISGETRCPQPSNASPVPTNHVSFCARFPCSSNRSQLISGSHSRPGKQHRSCRSRSVGTAARHQATGYSRRS